MFIQEGFNDFIEKPVELSVLDRLLRRNIPKEKIQYVETAEELREEVQKDLQQADGHTEEQIVTIRKTDEFAIGDLDVEKGLLYCGGKVSYLEILEQYCKNGNDHIAKIEKLFEAKDWKNYIIAVHGIKSSMMSIGAVTLSEKAKSLEFAGKESNYDFIRKEHANMIVEFERVMKVLRECSFLLETKTEQETIDKTEISEEIFLQKLTDLENATYELDAQKVMPILDELSEYAYHSKDLATELKPVYKKVEMFDFMSAYETVVRIKDNA